MEQRPSILTNHEDTHETALPFVPPQHRVFSIEDRTTRRQESLRTTDRDEAHRLFHAKNEAHQQPSLNLQIARAYLMAIDPAITTRTWQHALDEKPTEP